MDCELGSRKQETDIQGKGNGRYTYTWKGEGDMFRGQRVQNGWSVGVRWRNGESRSWRSGLVGLVCCVHTMLVS